MKPPEEHLANGEASWPRGPFVDTMDGRLAAFLATVSMEARRKRRNLEWSQQDVADRIGMNRGTILAFEKGKKWTDLNTLLLILDCLGLELQVRPASHEEFDADR